MVCFPELRVSTVSFVLHFKDKWGWPFSKRLGVVPDAISTVSGDTKE
jgi:hypothetical protein